MYHDLIQTIGPCHRLLPRQEEGHVDIHAFLTDTLLADTFRQNENLWEQAARVATMPGLLGLGLLPDTHVGYFLPIGGSPSRTVSSCPRRQATTSTVGWRICEFPDSMRPMSRR